MCVRVCVCVLVWLQVGWTMWFDYEIDGIYSICFAAQTFKLSNAACPKGIAASVDSMVCSYKICSNKCSMTKVNFIDWQWTNTVCPLSGVMWLKLSEFTWKELQLATEKTWTRINDFLFSKSIKMKTIQITRQKKWWFATSNQSVSTFAQNSCGKNRTSILIYTANCRSWNYTKDWYHNWIRSHEEHLLFLFIKSVMKT